VLQFDVVGRTLLSAVGMLAGCIRDLNWRNWWLIVELKTVCCRLSYLMARSARFDMLLAVPGHDL
jgi:hypothetical protein